MEKNFITETLKYIGGRIAFFITAGVVTLVFLVVGLYVSTVVRPKAARIALEREIAASEAAESSRIEASVSASVSESEAQELAASFDGTGVYVGDDGSVLILYDNGLADYYHESVGLNGLNVWTYENGTLDVSILCLLSEVTATFDEANPTTFSFVSDSAFWNNETFTLVSNDATSMTESELQALVDEYN